MDEINPTTWGRRVKAHPRDRIDVEIGDATDRDVFHPQFKVMRWDNEVNLSVRHLDLTPEIPATVRFERGVRDRVVWAKPDLEVHQYEQPDAGEDGGFEFEWVLLSRPATPVLTATIQTKGLDFLLQPPLTLAEVEDGCVRPDNVIGSYAVYHATQGGLSAANGPDYKTGKCAHIYRPKATDALGATVWGDLHIDHLSGLFTVTLPLAWLANAIYPVTVDPTFGFTSIGGTDQTSSLNQALVCKFTLADSNVDVSKVTIYCRRAGATTNGKGLVYADSAAYPGSRLGVSPAAAVATSSAWVDMTFSSLNIASAGAYWIGWIGEAGTDLHHFYDAGDTNQRYFAGDSYTSPADPYPAGGGGSARKFSYYATYTASAIVGDLSQTLDALTGVATGVVDVAGVTSATLDALTAAAIATADVAGDLDQTLDALQLLSEGVVGDAPVAGDLAQTLDALTSASAGQVDVAGDLAQTLDALTSASAGQVDVAGDLAQPLDAVTADAAGTVDVVGVAAPTLDALTGVDTGTVDVAGDLAQILDALTAAAIATADVAGALSQTLDAATLLGEGFVGDPPVAGELAQPLDALTGAAAGAVDVAGVSSPTLDALTAAAIGAADITGTLSQTLEALTATGAGTVALAGQVTTTLDDLAGAPLVGDVLVQGALAATLDALVVGQAAYAPVARPGDRYTTVLTNSLYTTVLTPSVTTTELRELMEA